jgi:hypothetical protein
LKHASKSWNNIKHDRNNCLIDLFHFDRCMNRPVEKP